MEDWEALPEYEEMRRDRPTLWLVLTLGPITPNRIAKLLLDHPDEVLLTLRDLKREGLVTDQENSRGGQMVWEVTSNLADLYNWRLEKLKSWKLR